MQVWRFTRCRRRVPTVSRATVPVVTRQQAGGGGAGVRARHHSCSLRDPAAAAAYLARQILAASGIAKVPRVITTLHGTDVTLIGSDPSYSETAAFCIDQSDGVTAVSESLRADTCRGLPVHTDIRVIPNFLTATFIGAGQMRGLVTVIAARSDNEADCPRLELPSGQTRGGRCRDLSPGARTGSARLLLVAMVQTCHRPADWPKRRAWEPTSSHLVSRSWSYPFCRSPTCSCCRPNKKASVSRRSRRWPARFRSWPLGLGGFRRSSKAA